MFEPARGGSNHLLRAGSRGGRPLRILAKIRHDTLIREYQFTKPEFGEVGATDLFVYRQEHRFL